MTFISPNDCTLQCGMWLWNHETEFIKWQHPAVWYVALGWHAIEFTQLEHPAMWHVALGSWHWIRQVAAPCNVAGGSGIKCHWIRPNRPPYWNSTPGFDFDHITAVDMSFCTSLQNFYLNRTTLGRKMTLCRFSRWRISTILDFRGPISGSLKSPCTTFYRSSIDMIALNCLVVEKIAFLYFGDRQTDKQTNRWTWPLHEAALAVASGGLIICSDILSLIYAHP